MRSADETQTAIFSYRTLEERIPADHPLRKLRMLVDSLLVTLHGEFADLYTKTGRPSIPPQDGGRNPTVDFKGEERKNDTNASTTDPEARLYKKSRGDKSQLCFLGHALTENRSGLVVDVETTQATGTAEREAAKSMVGRSVKRGATRGADKG